VRESGTTAEHVGDQPCRSTPAVRPTQSRGRWISEDHQAARCLGYICKGKKLGISLSSSYLWIWLSLC